MKFCRLFEVGCYQVLTMINDEQFTVTFDIGNGPSVSGVNCRTKSCARTLFEDFTHDEASKFICDQLSCNKVLHL